MGRDLSAQMAHAALAGSHWPAVLNLRLYAGFDAPRSQRIVTSGDGTVGVTQKHSKPNHPTTCGKVERFHPTLKKWLVPSRDSRRLPSPRCPQAPTQAELGVQRVAMSCDITGWSQGVSWFKTSFIDESRHRSWRLGFLTPSLSWAGWSRSGDHRAAHDQGAHAAGFLHLGQPAGAQPRSTYLETERGWPSLTAASTGTPSNPEEHRSQPPDQDSV
jgi:hypothetical protein